ncbi:hypothetical protein ACCS75_32365, partial [Rhizobium ruizarguesonis]
DEIQGGSKLDKYYPARGVNIPCLNTRSGLEALGGVVRVEAPSLDPADDNGAAVRDFQPPAFLTRPVSTGKADAEPSNVVSMLSTENRSGLRKPAWLKPKPAEISAD